MVAPQKTTPHEKPPDPVLCDGDPPIYWYETVDSTNTTALRLADEGAPHLTAVAARFQTAGRGKFNRPWTMPAGQGVLLTVLFRSIPRGIDITNMTLRMGWHVAQWLRRESGLGVTVKQPNDLMIGSRKLGGILTEARWRGEAMLAAAVGIGINVNVREFPDELKAGACSLVQESGREFDVESLTRSLIEHVRAIQ
jgi:BirA family biotin operon repressor/biotin-[acetyl-CoA-carboxylase] ligase